MERLKQSAVPDELEDLITLRRMFRNVFSSPEGRQVLAYLLNELCYFSADPTIMDPKLLAIANKILHFCGIIHSENLFVIVDRLMDAANDLDIEAARQVVREE